MLTKSYVLYLMSLGSELYAHAPKTADELSSIRIDHGVVINKVSSFHMALCFIKQDMQLSFSCFFAFVNLVNHHRIFCRNAYHV